MTRLFDALRRSHSAGAKPPLAPVPLAPAPSPPATRARKPVLELAPAPLEAVRRGIVHLPRAEDLPADVVREMAGLRVRLEVMFPERSPRTVMFLAAQGGEGTSTITTQFARALAADARLQVLLVDAHARRPAYAKDGSPLADGLGFSRVAGGNGVSAKPNLDLMSVPEAVVAAGGAAPQVLKGVLQAVSGGYDWVLVDSPPVLESPEAAPLAQVADGVIVIAQAGRTKRPVLTRAVDLVNRSGGQVIGIVLNRRRLEIPEFIYRRI